LTERGKNLRKGEVIHSAMKENNISIRKNSITALSRGEERTAYLFIAPQILGVLCFSLFPMIFSLFISFCKWDMMSAIRWRGLDNYIKIFSKKETWQIVRTTATYVVMHVPLSLLVGLLLALGLNKAFPGCYLLRTAFYLPHITSSVAVSVIWSLMFQKESGVINSVLAFVGIQGPGWINSSDWSIPSIVIVTVWLASGHNMILLLAGLKSIDITYYEAASIDGANSRQRFRHITLPMLTPTFFLIVCTGFIGSFQMFNEAYMLTGGGPGKSSTTLVLRIYQLAFQSFKMHEAAVYSWLLFAIVFVITIFQFTMQKRWVNYDV